MLNGLDLFTGIGGLTVALSPWVRPVAYCENDRYAQAVLLSRMERGDLPLAPVWDDVRTLQGHILPSVDVIYGGFPCQDISVAGNGVGLEGERSGLFFEIVRLVREIRPRFVFLENVPAITTRGLDRVTAEFSSLRYDTRWGVLSAFDVGAPHLRERWFLLAYAERSGNGPQPGTVRGLREETPQRSNETVSLGGLRSNVSNSNCERRELDSRRNSEPKTWSELFFGDNTHGLRDTLSDSDSVRTEPIQIGECKNSAVTGIHGSEEPVANASGGRLYESREGEMEQSGRTKTIGRSEVRNPTRKRGRKGRTESEVRGRKADPFSTSWWAIEPDVGRVAHGIPARVDRIRGLGNAVVPLQAREAFKKLMGL